MKHYLQRKKHIHVNEPQNKICPYMIWIDWHIVKQWTQIENENRHIPNIMNMYRKKLTCHKLSWRLKPSVPRNCAWNVFFWFLCKSSQLVNLLIFETQGHTPKTVLKQSPKSQVIHLFWLMFWNSPRENISFLPCETHTTSMHYVLLNQFTTATKFHLLCMY